MAKARTLSSYKSQLAGGGARPNLFEVEIPSFPTVFGGTDAEDDDTGGEGEGAEEDTSDNVWNDDKKKTFKFMCKAAQIPGMNVGVINVPFRGRILKVAGDRTFDEWTITVINDEDFTLRTAFEKWSNVMTNLIDNTGVTNPSSYMANKAKVKQLGRGNQAFSTEDVRGTHSVLRTYQFHDIWPSLVSPIELSYESTDAIEEFQVTFQVQYITIGSGADKSDETKSGIVGEKKGDDEEGGDT